MKNVLSFLEDIGIEYEKHEHEAVFTCEEANDNCPPFKGPAAKNLFLRNRNGQHHYLVILESGKILDLKNLAEKLDESSLSFASPDRLQKYLGLTAGAVSPMGLINDINNDVKVVIDSALMEADYVHCHPNVNTCTIELKIADFQKFLDYCGNEVTMMDFD